MKAVVVAGLVLLAGAAAWELVSDVRTRQTTDQLRQELRVARALADSCQTAVTHQEMTFREYDDRIDSLRSRVSGFEELDERGVPADSYRVYLEAFETYNESVEAWEMQVDTLRAHWGACRELVEAHNALADDFRAHLEDLELIDPRPGAPAPEGPGAAPAADPDER